MEQPTFADLEYRGKKRKTRRELFLERMDGLIPWQRLEGRIRPVYPKPGKGHRPYPLAVMLRIHCVQLYYNPFGKLRTGSATPAWRICSEPVLSAAEGRPNGQAVRGS